MTITNLKEGEGFFILGVDKESVDFTFDLLTFDIRNFSNIDNFRAVFLAKKYALIRVNEGIIRVSDFELFKKLVEISNHFYLKDRHDFGYVLFEKNPISDEKELGEVERLK